LGQITQRTEFCGNLAQGRVAGEDPATCLDLRATTPVSQLSPNLSRRFYVTQITRRCEDVAEEQAPGNVRSIKGERHGVQLVNAKHGEELVTWVIPTIRLREKPHRDENFNNCDC
jgi:hypothetical protein